MGNQTGSAVGSAAGQAGSSAVGQMNSGGQVTAKPISGAERFGSVMQTAGQATTQMAGQDQAQQEAILTQLAQMGPPPSMTASPTGSAMAGQGIVGQYQTRMAPPPMNYRSRQGAQLDPSIGAMLRGG